MALKMEYDFETHTPVRDGVLITLSVLAFFGAITLLVIVFALLFGSPQSENTTKWQTKYYELSCKSRGLELNTRNKLWLCQDPQTKAFYEVD